MFRRPITVVVHDGSFHPDDVMACAILQEYFARDGKKIKIIRSRDPKIQERADIVADTGNVYDSITNRFDHHQPEGAGVRDNGIPYASAGLVWKHYGMGLSDGNQEMFNMIDYSVIQSLDAADNGVSTFESKDARYPFPFLYGDALTSFRPAYGENLERDDQFLLAVAYAREILVRELAHARGAAQANKKIFSYYENSTDKELLIIDEPFSREDVNRAFRVYGMTETMLVVFPTGDELTGQIDGWKLLTVQKTGESFEPRLALPASWAGLRDEELQRTTGVADATFVHRARFMAVTRTREGALKLAEIALDR